MKHPCRETKKVTGLPQTKVLAGVRRRELQIIAAQQPLTPSRETVPRDSNTHAGSKRKGRGRRRTWTPRLRRKMAQEAGGKSEMCYQEESIFQEMK